MRGLGIGIAVFFGWATNGFLALYFPSLVAGIGITGSFFLFAGDRRGGAAVRVHPGARDPRPFPRGARRGRLDRGDLCRHALSRLSNDDGRSRYRGCAGGGVWADFSPESSCSVRSTPHSWRPIAAAATVRQFSAGDLVVDAFTAPPTEIYVVLTGEVDLWHDQDRVTKAGDDRFVAGEVFGFSAMLTERPIGPRVVATTSASIAVLPGNLVEPAFYSRSGARFLADYISRTRRRSTSAPMFSTVEDLIASTPLVVGPETPVAVIARQLADRDVHCAVVDSDDGTYGIVTDSVLGRRVVGDGVSADTPARVVMVHPATTVELSGSSVEALITLLDTRAEYLPVVDRSGNLRGVVGARDFVLAPTTAGVGMLEQIHRARNRAELIERARRAPSVLTVTSSTGVWPSIASSGCTPRSSTRSSVDRSSWSSPTIPTLPSTSSPGSSWAVTAGAKRCPVRMSTWPSPSTTTCPQRRWSCSAARSGRSTNCSPPPGSVSTSMAPTHRTKPSPGRTANGGPRQRAG